MGITLISFGPQAIKASPPPQTMLVGLFTLWRSRKCGQKKLRAAFHRGASLNSGKQVLFTDRDPVRWYESSKNTISKLYKLITSPAITINPLCQVNFWMADGDPYKWGDMCLGYWLIPITWVSQTFLYYSNFQLVMRLADQAVMLPNLWTMPIIKDLFGAV